MASDQSQREDEPEIISNRKVDTDENALTNEQLAPGPTRESLSRKKLKDRWLEQEIKESCLRLASEEEFIEEAPLQKKTKRSAGEAEEFAPIDYFDDEGEAVGSIASESISNVPERDDQSGAVLRLVESLETAYEEELERTIKELGDIGPRALTAVPALLAVRNRILFESAHPDDWKYYANQFAKTLHKITGRESSQWTQVDEALRVLPARWPAADAVVKPGVLDDLPLMSFDIRDSGDARPGRSTSTAPFCDTLVFDNGQCRSALKTLHSEMGVHKDEQRFAAFIRINRPGHPRGKYSRYLVQMRLVTESALKRVFQLPADAVHDAQLTQKLSIGEALNTFVEDQIGVFWPNLVMIPCDIVSARLQDVESYREGLGFGFFVENHVAGVYRIWSRMWMNADWRSED